jgi:hypothetical protein
MTGRNNRPKKTSRPAARAASAPARAKTKASGSKTAYYVTEAASAVVVSDQKPKNAAQVRQYASFDEAKSAAVDGLVQAIEDAERQLVALKRAASYKELCAGPKSRLAGAKPRTI